MNGYEFRKVCLARHFLQDDLLQACREVRVIKLVYAAIISISSFTFSDLAGQRHMCDREILGMLAVRTSGILMTTKVSVSFVTYHGA